MTKSLIYCYAASVKGVQCSGPGVKGPLAQGTK